MTWASGYQVVGCAAWASPTASRRPPRRPGPADRARRHRRRRRHPRHPRGRPHPHDLEVAKRAMALGAPDPYSLITHDEVVALTGIPVGGPSLTYADDDLGRAVRRPGRASPGVVVRRPRRPRGDRGHPVRPRELVRVDGRSHRRPRAGPDLGDAAVYGRGLLYVRGEGRAFYVLIDAPTSRRPSCGPRRWPAGSSSGSHRARRGSGASGPGRATMSRPTRRPPRPAWPSRRPGAGGSSPPPCSARASPSSTRPSSTSRCPTSATTSTRASAACSGCSTGTCWPCRR